MSYYHYLASPYSHRDPEVMHQRYVEMERITAEYLRNGIYVYSPIVHCHYLALNHTLPRDAAYWHGYNKAMLRHARSMHVIQLPGWKDSIGITLEVDYCKSVGIPIEYVFPTVAEE